ncbi:chromosome segregation protein SMC [Oceanobacter mangrovi]|uniref:chromosome segregation protein SMC n=1 Tax=Oceanobacter mangrovi TaxID=2862510 RepID=UPI001C8E1816|nr:chromosome segregation protein SMC [Oceanobacter mangrovi]
MRLKAIKLSGFKSFVDPTTVSFNTNMTGIVGPNGCGKSNTIDAVRWVMGESSAKYLRGDAMTDVIFNGSSERKPVGKASVDLIFDNSDRTLRGEYAAYNEISVRRQVTRDGQSNYFLNGARCRRKDITDLFLGTGLGPRSYAIIEQGMISRLIEAKPDELRVYVEEAAGISRYKDRRRETENRMRRTMENLERLQDIRDELERQLGHLQRQADAAEKYKALKTEERQKKAQLQALKWQLLDQDYRQRELQIAQHQTRMDEHQARQTHIDAENESLRLQQQERNDDFQTHQGRFYEIGARIARQEQKIEHQSQMSLELDRNLQEAERQILELQQSIESDQFELEQLQNSSFDLDLEQELLREQLEQARLELEDVELAQSRWQDQWQQFTQRAGEPARQAEVAQTRIQSLEQQLLRLDQQIQKLQAEKQQLLDNPELEEIELLAEEVSEFELQSEEQQMRAEQARGQLETARAHIEEQRRQVTAGREQLSQLSSRKATLEALQKAALGQSNEAVARWLETHQLARAPRLAQHLQVESGWEQAVEVVLDDQLHALLVDDLPHAAQWLKSLKEGRLVLRDKAASSQPPGSLASDSLLHKVNASQDLSDLLANARCCDSLELALAQRSQLARGEFWITPDGSRIGRQWVRVARAAEEQGSLLARQQELELLHDQWDQLDMDVEEWEAELESAQLRLHSQEQQREAAQREWQQASQQLTQLKSQLAAKQARAEQFGQRRERIDADLEEASEQRLLQQQEVEELRIERQLAHDAIETHADERDQLLQQQSDLKLQLEDARALVQQQQQNWHQFELGQRESSSRKQALETALQRLELQLQQWRQRRQLVLDSQQQDHTADLQLLKEELQEMLEQRQQAELQMQDARRLLDETEARMRQLENERSRQEQLILEIRNQLEAVRMECQALDIRRQALIEQLQEEKLTLKDVLENMPEEAAVERWQQDLEDIAEKIRRLGNINLAAIDEYKVQSERKTYLDAQHADLETALATLENAIHKIDRETRTRFKETFDKINAGLAELFPKVFGGGHAWLDLTDEDMLVTGVAIMARPPGKKNSTIHLLSGGEKALTAIALVFSIFQLNPAPFCMLDEVDAPLDDANVGRYARLVKAMSEKVQFIYITHNKIAMEMASQLMGVTMQEPGVSRLVSVDVEEAAEMIDQ